MWQTLSAVLRITTQANPPATRDGPVGFLEALRNAHAPIFELDAFEIATAVERTDDFARELCCLDEDRLDDVRRRRLKCRDGGGESGQACQLIEHEADVVDGGAVFGHGFASQGSQS